MVRMQEMPLELSMASLTPCLGHTSMQQQSDKADKAS